MNRRDFLWALTGAAVPLGTGAFLTRGKSQPAPALPQLAAPKSANAFVNRALFGINLAGVIDWTTEWPLIDVFKPSRPWVTETWGDAHEAGYAFDAADNPLVQPGQMAQTFLAPQGSGPYVLTWTGTGRVAVKYSVENVKETAHRIEFDRTERDGGNVLVQVLQSDPNDPVRALRAVRREFENSPATFHPLFLERLQPFGTVRFMDWQSTNNSTLQHWSERPKPSDAHYTRAGMPLETMIDLANTLHANPWFCMPFKADDTFVREFATMVQGRLDPRLQAHVELSNELWNGAFSQARDAQKLGRAANLSDNDFQAGLYYQSRRSVQVFSIWESVFGTEMKTRVVRVLGSQAVNSWVSEQVLSFEQAAEHTDALAIAPYFGNEFGDPKRSDEVLQLGVDGLLRALKREVGESNREWIQSSANVAKKFGVRLIAYEGGQHLVGIQGAENNDRLRDLFFAANRDARMSELYTEHFHNWFALGGSTYCVFAFVAPPSKWGSWGVLETQDQPVENAPKYRAVLSAISNPKLLP